jgi:Cof subfamily protein (haloacid dehalogenase superfamily)
VDQNPASDLRLVSRPSLDELRLVATDYDGTLLGAGREVSDRTRRALQLLADSHVEFAVITGRPPRFCDNIAQQTAVDLSLICANGAVGYDPASGEVTQFATINLDVAHALIEELALAHPNAGFCAEMGNSWIADEQWAEITGRRIDTREGDVHIRDVRDHLDERLHKLLITIPDRTPDEALGDVHGVVGERVNAMHAGLPFIELMPPGVDKAFGLRLHCEARGIDPSQVMTFGDMPNDIAMLDWAGWGVAVDNAHDRAKSAANEVTASNLDHGVAQIIEQLF